MSVEEFFGRHLLGNPRQFRLASSLSTEKVNGLELAAVFASDGKLTTASS
ncbi:MAG TPA: hypothetical protein PL117_15110 [Accumulibacter sp.]|nr:hypothetical protein [Accumulibacter sp.]HRF74096.1 hypothetical protein [Accumulibacter sp.]